MSPLSVTKTKAFVLPALALLALGASSSVSAGPRFAASHPRRAEVNARLANQDARIHQEVRTGEIGRPEARALHAEDRGVRQEERAMARADGRHITPGEQAALNRQENTVSRQIGR